VDFVIPQKGSSLIEAYNTWRGWADPKGKQYDVSCTVNASNKRQPKSNKLFGPLRTYVIRTPVI